MSTTTTTITPEEVNGRTLYFWQVAESSAPTADDGTPILYGRGVAETREKAEEQARENEAGAEARRDAMWRRRWHALVVDGMTTTDAQIEARRQMHAEGWWA
jgi:hypothetical protein